MLKLNVVVCDIQKSKKERWHHAESDGQTILRPNHWHARRRTDNWSTHWRIHRRTDNWSTHWRIRRRTDNRSTHWRIRRRTDNCHHRSPIPITSRLLTPTYHISYLRSIVHRTHHTDHTHIKGQWQLAMASGSPSHHRTMVRGHVCHINSGL
jgi:hypothetical protein